MKDKISIIGAGISGLTCAIELAEKGFDVELIEETDSLGGLATFFQHNGLWLEKFYHCIMPSDEYLLNLIGKVNLSDQLYFKQTYMGFIVNSKMFSFNTAWDLLNFTPLSFIKRLRFGLVSLFLRQLGKNKDLDNLSIKKWLGNLYGEDIWTKIFFPLFISKFGNQAENLPALYIWARLGREKNVIKRGYLKCGYKGFIDALEGHIKDLGGKIHYNSQVKQIKKMDDGFELYFNENVIKSDWVISTIPIPLLKLILSDGLQTFSDILPNLPYQGIVNVLFFLKKPLDQNYWCPVVDSNTDFDGIVGMSNLIDLEQLGGNHLVYTMKYVDKNASLFQEEENDIKLRWTDQLLALYKNLPLNQTDVTDVRVFKTPFVEPIYTLGYKGIKPTIRPTSEKLLLATTSQIYPNITCCNSSVRFAHEVVSHILTNKEK